MQLSRMFALALVFSSCSVAAESPRVLLIAQNAGTEITDLLVPYAVLAEAGAKVRVVASEAGPVSLWPALTLHADTTLADAPPADLIVVPAVRDHRDARLLSWLTERHRSGTPIASICDGVLVLAEAGLLTDRRATGHFYSHRRRTRDYPEVTWLRDVRFVVDGPVSSSAGVSASAPASIRMVETLMGPATATRVAAHYGIDPRDEHDSDAFRIGPGIVLTAIGNALRGLRKREYQLRVEDGVDEFSLAFATDMLMRTGRARVVLAGETPTVRTAHGLTLSSANAPRSGHPITLPPAPPRGDEMLAIDAAGNAIALLFDHLEGEFGRATADFVALQLEMPR